MNAKIEDISSIKKKISFEVAAEKVDSEIDKAYKKIAKTAKIKGFRPGKIPRKVLEQYYAPQMEQEVLTRLINDSYFKAISENDIPAVGDPEIVDSGTLEQGKPFNYEAEVEVKPEVEAKDYTGLELQKEKFTFDESVVDSRLEEMRSGRAEMEESSNEQAQTGDFVTIDFEGFIEGEAFTGGKADDYSLELGSGTFIPGFEEQVEGMKKGEEKEVQVSFPEDYGNKDLAGKPATFKVTLKEIKEKVLPALDDEFAKSFGLESMEELREKIAESYKTQETNRVEGDLRERLVNALVERNPIEVPEGMVSKQLDYMLGNIRQRLQSQGMSLEMMGMNEESFRSMYRDTAVNQVKGALLLEAVGRQEDLQVEPSEIDGKLEEIAEMSNAPLDAVKKYYGSEEARGGLMAQVKEEKAIKFIMDNSKIVEVDKEELASQDESPEKE